MTRFFGRARAALLTLGLLAAGLVGACGKTEPELLMIAAGVPKPDVPTECTAPSPDEPQPAQSALAAGYDGEAAARAARANLLWGRDVAGMRMVCRAWLSAYVAARWPEPSPPGKPVRVAGGG